MRAQRVTGSWFSRDNERQMRRSLITFHLSLSLNFLEKEKKRTEEDDTLLFFFLLFFRLLSYVFFSSWAHLVKRSVKNEEMKS